VNESGSRNNLHILIRNVIARIPRGRVATYGQIARLAGLKGQARLVGYALHATPAESSIPWHRVLNAQGAISTRGTSAERQRKLLLREGVRFDARGRVSLEKFQWRPRASSARSRSLSGSNLIRPERNSVA